MKRIWKVFDSFGKYVLVIAVLGIMISCVGQVIARFVFNSSLRWSNEVARYLLCYLTFIGAFVLIKEKNFIKMDVLEAKVTPQARPYYDVIMEILMISYAIVIMIYGNELALKNALAVQEAEGYVSGPRRLSTPGAHSYLYALFLRFGVISGPEA